MDTIIQKINSEFFEDCELEKACQILKQGGLIAFPTETVYGLGGDALSQDAAKKIYTAKGRPSDNPLIVHIADMKSLYDVAQNISRKALDLAEAYWPGPMTMIFQKTDKVPLSTTGGHLIRLRSVCRASRDAKELIRQSGVYVAAPSANTSGRPSPTRAEHVIEDLQGKIDMIIDGGHVGIGLESTIVDMTGETPVILRPGYITKEMLEEVVGEVDVDPAVLMTEPKKNIVAKAPGMKYRHYAPRGQLTIIEGKEEAVIQKINEIVLQKEQEGCNVAVIATEESKDRYHCKQIFSIGSRKSEGSIAAGVYDILRRMDAIGAEYIYTESFAQDHLGQAIMNRMIKAAGYHKIEV